MSWFNKKKEKKLGERMSALPELPALPEFPRIKEDVEELKKPLHQLPQFPQSSLGEQFSQNTIKEAITGKEEGDKEVYGADEFDIDEDEGQMMHRPLKKPLAKEISPLEKEEELATTFSRKKFHEAPEEFKEAASRVKKIEPVFIRIDKFEESLHIFEKTKNQLVEIEKMLKDIQLIRQEEETELHAWENGLKKMKEELEKVERDIFSKIE